MFVIPAIDLKGGKCVRLVQGDPNNETVYNEDPVSQARFFRDNGAKLIHIVDLDGAFEGSTANYKVIKQIRDSIDVDIEVGGGIRSAVVIEKYLQIGIKRLIIGTMALKPEFQSIANDYYENLIVGIDAKEGFVATHGWQKVTETRATEFAARMKDLGIREIIYTDIATDGMLEGPNLAGMQEMVEAVPGLGVIASGGVSLIDDIKALKGIDGVRGCIVGKAIYDGRVDIKEALEI